MMKTAYISLFFKALGNKTRLRIALSLRDGPKCVKELCKTLGLEQSRVSHNLRCLTNCGFVNVKREGKNRIYSLNEETISPLFKLVDQHIVKYRDRLVKCELLRK